jgi:Trk-type K+ transport system membrane component
MVSSRSTSRMIVGELASHAPFTVVGALSGIAIMVIVVLVEQPQPTVVARPWSTMLFWVFHPLHVFLSALATTGMYRLHGKGKLWAAVAIGYLGSIGIATLSDSLIPYLGESLLGLHHGGLHGGFVEEAHLGFIEKWWLVNPLAIAGITVGCLWPRTKYPHAGHVLLSTWASLFHMTMSLGESLSAVTYVVVFVFLFLSVWLPCCVSDIVFPLLFCKEGVEAHQAHRCSCADE